jgi:hypothetical protein
MSVWAVVDGDAILSASILCGEHAKDPAVLTRVYENVEHAHSMKVIGFEQLPDGDAALARDCVECKTRGATQPDLPAPAGSPSPTSQETNQPVTEQAPECEEPVEYVHEKMDAVAPVPWDLELIDTESLEYGETRAPWTGEDGPDAPTVTLTLGVEETVWYPATVTVPAREYDALLALFPQLKRHDLPMGLMMRLATVHGARVVVDERHGDVQGQTPVGPLAEGERSGDQ